MMFDFSQLSAPGPTRTKLTAPFWDAAGDGRLVLQHCDACGCAIFYPRSICPHCWSNRLRWQDAIGRGRLKSFSIVHRPGHPAWDVVAPYAIGLVELAEGPTMLSHILAPLDQLAVGMPLAIKMTRVGKETLPFFVPDEPINRRGTK